MKKFIYIFLAITLFISCEDVIELDLNNTDSRLVIDAQIERDGESGNTFTTIRLTRSAGFYDEDIVFVNDAVVTVTDNSTGQVIPIDLASDGIYNSSFPFIRATDPTQDTFTLTINDNGTIYTATENLELTVPIIEVEEETISGFGDDFTQIKAFFNEPAGLGNFYLFEYVDANNDQVDISNDEFSDGNVAQTTFFLEVEDEDDMNTTPVIATIRIKGIDETCFNFYEILLAQAGEGGGGPFSTQPAVVKGNIINTTNFDRYPFGYFRISEVFEVEYTLE